MELRDTSTVRDFFVRWASPPRALLFECRFPAAKESHCCTLVHPPNSPLSGDLRDSSVTELIDLVRHESEMRALTT
jgi:hypothetical protein